MTKRKPKPEFLPEPEVEPVLEAKELAKDYGDQLGLDPTTLRIGAGELVLLVGPNGAGKSTFLGLCAGLLEPTGGEALVTGAEVGSMAARAATSVIPDDPVLYDDLSVWEHAQYVARLHHVDDWEPLGEELLHRLGLEQRRDDLPSRFSRGLRQKTSLLLGLLRPADLLLIDEPFVGLDSPGQATLVELLEEIVAAGVTAVVSSHQLDLADRASRCVGLRDGAVVHDGEASRDVVRDLTGG
jgi:ABC-type multidrug transport system ATPase subunit